MSERANM